MIDGGQGIWFKAPNFLSETVGPAKNMKVG